MSADDLESLQETIHWLSQPGIREDLDQARRDIASGETVSGEELRREFGLPPR
jgi:antitoxin YefM